MKPATSTEAVIRHFLQDPEMPKTVRAWLRSERVAEDRILFFAINLAEDVLAAFRVAEDKRDPLTFLHNHLWQLAVDRVNWQKVAAVLLRHFGPKQAWAPAALRGSRN